MTYVDCHCHLADNVFYREIAIKIKQWQEMDITAIGAISTDFKTSIRNLELAEKYPNLIYPAIGRHPWGAHKFTDSIKEKFDSILSDNRVAFIGEIGLDYYFVKEENKYRKQKEVMEYFLKKAEKLKKPVMIHLTGAERDLIEILTTYKSSFNICCHWYSGPLQELEELISMGCYFSINLAFFRSKKHRRIVHKIGSEKILTESDGPVKFDNEYGNPGLMPLLCREIALELKISIDDLTFNIKNNFFNYLSNKNI